MVAAGIPKPRADHAEQMAHLAIEIRDALAAYAERLGEPLQIRLVHGPTGERVETNVAVTMRTPGDDAALAIGFLHGEGVIRDRDRVDAVQPCRIVLACRGMRDLDAAPGTPDYFLGIAVQDVEGPPAHCAKTQQANINRIQ